MDSSSRDIIKPQNLMPYQVYGKTDLEVMQSRYQKMDGQPKHYLSVRYGR
jgi:hypothetical protein